jgi:hypothetical protein
MAMATAIGAGARHKKPVFGGGPPVLPDSGVVFATMMPYPLKFYKPLILLIFLINHRIT